MKNNIKSIISEFEKFIDFIETERPMLSAKLAVLVLLENVDNEFNGQQCILPSRISVTINLLQIQ